jgi:hypothetical protein
MDKEYDFLDVITILNLGLQMQEFLTSPSYWQMVNSKLDRLLQIAEGSSTGADKHPSNAQ